MIELLTLSQLLSKSNKTETNSNGLQLSPIQLNKDYCKEWNENMSDFVVLTKNGELISNSLYRVGGFSCDIKKDYFMLLKYVESFYEMDFLRECHKDKSNEELKLQQKYLEGHWCILDKNGVEKKVFESYKSPYIKNNSCIYSLDNKYYNIETGELYCNSYKSMESTEYIFLENPYDKDLSRKGVMKINKKDGSWSVFS